MSATEREARTVVAGVVACFFLSGATGLVYEVLWIRMLGLVFGHTVFAVTTVLTAFMAGLGLGSWLFGRIADRQRSPLRLYGVLEIGIGLFCLAVPLLLPVVERAYLALSRALGLSFVAFSLAQFALILLIFLPPTTLMGATLPILSRFFVTEDRTLGRRVGLLYALNTAGAVLGTALAGYVLLPALGVRGTLSLAAALNIGIGALVIVFDRHWTRLATRGATPAAAAQPTLPALEPATAVGGLARRLTVLGLALAGAASMIYEVAWTRALSLVIGSSTYAFTAMLVAFLLGIALGSALFSRLLGTRAIGPAGFGLLQLAIGLAALGILPLFERMPDLLVRVFAVSLSPGFVLLVQVVAAVAAMIVPTLLIGASFPCAVRVAARGVGSVGVDVGRLYAVNTLGAIVGTVLAGFFLIPTFGAQAAAKTGVLVNLVLGAAVVLAAARGLRRVQWVTAAGLAAAATLLLAWLPAWNQAVMASGVAVYAPQYQRFAGKLDLARALSDSRLLFYEDGLGATVSVHRHGETTLLRVNGKTDASNGLDMHTQLMVGHLPLLAHPAPRSVLVVGLASGVTVGAVLQHPVERVDVIEIEPAMLRASEFFARDNRAALRDPRVRVVIADARNFLLATEHRYDVIISEPSNPWIGGIAALFTREFYELVNRRLNPGGIMLQWIDGYTIQPDDLRMVVKTFRTGFPAVSIWNAQAMADFILLGRAEGGPLDLARIRLAWERSPGLREDFARLGFHSPPAFLADFLLGETDAARYAQTGDVNTDDLLPLEFSAPRSMHRDTAALNYRTLKAFKTVEFPVAAGALDEAPTRHHLGLAYLRKTLPAEAAAQFERALARDPGYVPSLVELGRTQLRQTLPLKAVETLTRAVTRDARNAEAHWLLAQAYQGQQLTAAALRHAERAVALAPDDGRYRAYTALLLQSDGRLAEAVTHYLRARRARPGDVAVLDGLATTYLKQGKAAEAVATLEEAVSHAPENALLLQRLGRAYLAHDRPALAVTALERALVYSPLLPQAHVDLGYAHLGQGNLVAAMTTLERGLSLDPAQPAATQILSDIYARLYTNR